MNMFCYRFVYFYNRSSVIKASISMISQSKSKPFVLNSVISEKQLVYFDFSNPSKLMILAKEQAIQRAIMAVQTRR